MMDQLWAYDLPFPATDLKAIEGLLRGQGVFCTSFPSGDVYSLAFYYQLADLYGTSASIVLDRNVFSRVVDLASGRPAGSDHRIAAAVMAFGQCADMIFQPGLAVHEGLASQPKDVAAHDLALFHAADNLDPSEFVDIALSKTSRLKSRLDPEKPDDRSISTQSPHLFSLMYPPVLKLGLIQLEGGPMADRMCRFLDWTYSNWYMSAPATVFAAMCFSRCPPRNIFKDLLNRDRSLALKGPRNCAWDLTYVTSWGELLKQQSSENRLYLFCTRDRALRRVADQVLAEPHLGDQDIRQKLSETLGVGVYEHYVQLAALQDDPLRAINRVGSGGVALGRQMAEELELQLQSPIPSN